MKYLSVLFIIAMVAYLKWPEDNGPYPASLTTPVAQISSGAVFNPADYVADEGDTLFVFGAEW